MKAFWKSTTLQSLAVLLAASAPGLSDPLWSTLIDSGVAPEWVARAKLGAYVLGALGVAYGRIKATGGVTLR